MARRLKFLNISLIVFCTSLLMCYDFCFACVINHGNRTFDLSTLDWPSWPAVSKNGSDIVLYDISICKPLNSSAPSTCADSSVCRRSNGTATEMGKFAPPSNLTVLQNALSTSGFTLFLRGSECSEKSNTTYSAMIYFVCGATLGAPEVVGESECDVQFQWKTSAVCPTPEHHQVVPCYVIDDEGNKRNLERLSLLLPTSVVYENQHENMLISITVCSDIRTGDHCKNCSAGTSAYRTINGQDQPIGRITSGLQLTNDALVLIYEPPSNQTLPGCDLPPTTTVIFRCPERLKGQRPRVISDIDCQYEIEWQTEHACPEHMLKGDFETCKFTKETDGIDLDLSPLRRENGFYQVNGTFGLSEPSTFVFNVCGGLGDDYECEGSKSSSHAVCLIGSNSSKVLASTANANLMLLEGHLSLRYEGLECGDGYQQILFSFLCKSNARNNGTGIPVHISSDKCMHFFYWETKYACLNYKPELSCSASAGDLFFDLGKLRKSFGSWTVLSPIISFGDAHPVFLMNVCGSTLGSMNGNLNRCDGDPAVARIGGLNKCINLGEFTSSPKYNPATQSVLIEYTNGSICRENLRWSSIVEFKCHPGFFYSEVILTHVNEAGCVNEFEFRSALACPTTNVTGMDCKLADSRLGMNIDLSPLNYTIHEVRGPTQKFYLSVCRRNDNCMKFINSSYDVGACSVSLNASDPKPQILGALSSNISYVYGSVSLKYISDPSAENNRTRTVILFLCSIHGGLGNPIFSKQIRNTYLFHWYTSLVCPQSTSTECVVSNPKTGQQYDFSGLSKPEGNNWVAYFNEQNGDTTVKRKLYINVCRSLNPAPSCDDPDAGACIVTIDGEKETRYLSNVGRATGTPQLEADDHFQLLYSDGKSCTSFGENTNYSTVVHFICSNNESGGLRFLGKVGECQYSFLWTTKAACPLDVISVQNECILTDPETGFSFDLTSLDSSENSYSIVTKEKTYMLNICSPVMRGCTKNDTKTNIGACEVSEDGQITVLGTTTDFTLQYTRGHNLILTYLKETDDSKGNQSSGVVITLPCDSTASEPKPSFLEEKNQIYYFELRTPLTCLQEVADCNIRDHAGNEYDLTSLFRSTRNWEVVDAHEFGKSNVAYSINFCRPLIKTPNYKCPGGATGACQFNLKSPQSLGLSLGSQLSTPTVYEGGSILFRFTGGDRCESGQRRSASVNLFCSHKQGKLSFMGETPECEYMFSMNTPAACSSKTAMGKDCIVRDPVYGHTFNLNSLKNKNDNISVVDGGYEYFIKVCGELKGFSGECEHSGACQTKSSDPGFSKSLGLPNADLMYSEGIITLSYNFGSLCHKKYNRTAVIKFTCQHSTSNTDVEKPYFISEAENCAYLFEWPTRLACPPFEASDCSVTDDSGLLYDLSDLSLPSDNYYIRNPWSQNQTFVINVCSTVVYTPDSLCPYAAASCLLDPSNADTQKRALNIGQITRPPYFENGKLKMKYSAGAPCEFEKHTGFKETIIEFICDKQKISSEPEFLGQDVCTYYFQWSTIYACNLISPESDDNCHVTDPYTGVEFDFSGLKADKPYRVETLNHQYFLNICGSVTSSPCGVHSGVCQQELYGKKRTWNAGNANSVVHFEDGVLFLNYTGGDSCHNGTYQRNTIIQFHCSAGPDQLNFLHESSDCTYYFTWTTSLACQSLVHCAVRNGSHFFDLTPLTDNLYYAAESHLDSDTSTYYISVCSALSHVPAIPSCPVGSAVCRSDGSTSVNLGRVSFPPFIDFEDHATIIYTNGSQCESNPSEQYKSRIIFYCDPDEFLGYPVLVRREDDVCLHVFEWRTSIICPLEFPDTPKTPSCFFYENSTGTHFDLSGMRKTGSQYEVDGNNGDIFLVNMCEGVSENKCNNSAVCLRNGNEVSSFGSVSSQKFTHVGNQLRAMYEDGDKCASSDTGTKSAEIMFVCDAHNGIGKPRLRKKYGCLVVFVWETNLVCRNIPHSCSFNIGKKNFDINYLSSLSHNWKTTDTERNLYFINLCRGFYNNDETKGCPSSAAICMKQNNSFMALGLVHTMTKNLTDSGELLLTYTSGSTRPCSSVNSSVQPLTAGTKILLKCGTSFGDPQFQSGPDHECFFNFIWKTSVACEVKNEELIIENNGTLYDKRLDYEIDLSEIMNRTYNVNGSSQGENYTYVINIGQGYKATTSNPDDRCSAAAVCQTKSGNPSSYRDIGSINSRKFVIKGSDLHLILTSETKGCGKYPSRNVTTLFTMKCTSYEGDGVPVFMYESRGCDYLFVWDINAVCPLVHRRDRPVTEIPPPASHDDIPEGQVSKPSSHAAAAVVAVLCIILILCPIVYIVSNQERRAAAATKIRNAFHQVTLPHFRYRRAGGEMLILINGEQVHQSDDFKDDDLLS